eukprot:TRINITY_DN91007_c0_g1_i1.p1 TRINITY_DN91007_c0_g1~~TRINITY_DN91007_c0_g1_i1.p1  ORF type:complete len:565 (-),score=107.63 TRINITY_DN91007_c0_g1_i1:91-1689(-)
MVKTAGVDSDDDAPQAVTVLDPYKCIAKKNRKYATECTEVYLSNQGATELSTDFKHFVSLESIWFNGNRLSRLDNLEHNFRIREVYVQDNRLVSLAGIKGLKFLTVLMAGNNQLRNLDKQLQLFERFAFLKTLDLANNPVAEEPDYRLRLIYQVPQVELLDSKTVKGPERIKADEVVPNLDKVSAPQPEKARKKGQPLSLVERDCFNAADAIRAARRRAEEAAMSQTFAIPGEHAHAKQKCYNTEKARNRDAWGDGMMAPADPRTRLVREATQPSAWEKANMKRHIIKVAEKEELTADDVTRLAQALAHDGLEADGSGTLRVKVGAEAQKSMAGEVGRVLDSTDAATRILPRGRSESKASRASKTALNVGPHPLDKLLEGAEAKLPVGDVADYLLTLKWPRPPNHRLNPRIQHHEEERRWANLGQNYEELAAGQEETLQSLPSALRLEGLKGCLDEIVIATRKNPLGGGSKADLKLSSLKASTMGGGGTMRKNRSDFFPQSFLMPKRDICPVTGKNIVQVTRQTKGTALGCG